ncbi:DUF2461 domain-containing protein [Bacteroidia bacterium]|nr:DUF2461 domain-containing protein [Bacteroidia bacterium]
MIQQATFSFLKDLQKNNTRDWFKENKKRYDTARKELLSFLDATADQLNLTDVLEDKKIFRINRDIRFSKDKSPYKSNLSGYFVRAGASRRGGYFISIEPGGKTIVGGGFYAPEKDDLLRIRREFEMDATEIEKITSDKNFIKHFGLLRGDTLKSAPRDFDKAHPNIKWIRMKQFYVMREFTDKEVIADTFEKEVMNAFLAIRPFFDYMSDVLTTNLNGESIL